MYVERLPSGLGWGIYMDNGRRIALRATQREANRHMSRLRKKGARE